MKEKCELLEKCGFFLNYEGNTEVIKKGWIELYCASRSKSEKCKRKQIRQRTGNPPADNMSPVGEML